MKKTQAFPPVTAVVVQGKPYTVTELPAVNLSDDYGRCASRELSIQIARNQAPAQLRDTLLHEVIHALSFELHLELEERQVHVLASGLLDTLRRNPELAMFLLS